MHAETEHECSLFLAPGRFYSTNVGVSFLLAQWPSAKHVGETLNKKEGVTCYSQHSWKLYLLRNSRKNVNKIVEILVLREEVGESRSLGRSGKGHTASVDAPERTSKWRNKYNKMSRGLLEFRLIIRNAPQKNVPTLTASLPRLHVRRTSFHKSVKQTKSKKTNLFSQKMSAQHKSWHWLLCQRR